MATTTVQPLPYPLPGDPADGPAQLKALAEAVEDRTVMRFASIAARDAAIPAGRRVPGMHVFIQAENAVYVWDGGTWRTVWREAPWVDVTPAAGWGGGLAVTKRGDVVYHRGMISPTSARTLTADVWYPIGTVPVGYQSNVGHALIPATGLISGFTGALVARLSVGGVGLIEISPIRAAAALNTNSVIAPALPPTTTDQ